MADAPTFLRASTRLRARVVLACATAILAACGSAPQTHFHTLLPGTVVQRAANGGGGDLAGLPVLLESVRLPVQVEQPQWLVRLPDDSLALLEQERWASPLPDEFRAALLEQLVAGHGAVDARTQPSPPPAPPWRITVDVRRFDSLSGREARIEGSWTIQANAPRATAARCEWLLREDAPGALAAIAAAHRRAVARLGDAIAMALARAASGGVPACPAGDERR